MIKLNDKLSYEALPAFAKPVLYEVPTYLALNLNRSDEQKNKKKKKRWKIKK